MMRSKLEPRLRHRVLVGRDEQPIGAERQRVGFLVRRAAHHRHVGAQRRGELDRHVAEPAQADDADAAARADVPGAQRRIGGDAGAEQRRGAGEVQPVGHPQDEFLAHHEVPGVAAVGPARR